MNVNVNVNVNEPVAWGEDDILDAMLEFDPSASIHEESGNCLPASVRGRRVDLVVTAYLNPHWPHSVSLVEGESSTNQGYFADPIEAIQYALALSRE